MWEENAMRALRVLGLAEDGENLVCQDDTSGELFTLPADERLRAATRGDISRLGQLQIELEPQLRPREIQARIRAGNSIEQVAVAASCSVSRIERYAYPVLLERSTMAAKAREAHPMIDGNPARKTLEQLVMNTLGQRGQDAEPHWDAYRDDDGWIVVLRWQAGRSENRAHWDIHPGARNNTLHPRDDAARDLIDPSHRPLRTIADPTTETPRQANSTPSDFWAVSAGQQQASVSTNSAPDPQADETPTSDPQTLSANGSRHPAGTRRSVADRLDQEQMVEQTVLDERAGAQTSQQPRPAEVARTGTDHSAARGQRKGQRPVMPGWEDVLLGGGQPKQ
jgi:hypothetical protein